MSNIIGDNIFSPNNFCPDIFNHNIFCPVFVVKKYFIQCILSNILRLSLFCSATYTIAQNSPVQNIRVWLNSVVQLLTCCWLYSVQRRSSSMVRASRRNIARGTIITSGFLEWRSYLTRGLTLIKNGYLFITWQWLLEAAPMYLTLGMMNSSQLLRPAHVIW